jgi:hypothetical protein
MGKAKTMFRNVWGLMLNKEEKLDKLKTYALLGVLYVILLKALTDHFEGGSRVYSFDPYW